MLILISLRTLWRPGPDTMIKVFGLIGYPLTHSFSESYFRQKFQQENITDAVYKVFPLPEIEDFITLQEKEKALRGLNVTIPYKEKIIPFLDRLDEEASRVGAVNTIKFSNGRKTGYNSDIYGFEHSLLPLLQPHQTEALILGTGGASKAVSYVLKKLGISYHFISSSKRTDHTLPYADLSDALIRKSTLIVNTTPLGMYPDTGKAPDLSYEAIGDKHLLYDLIYNPEETLFLQKGKEKGARIKNGLEMLYLQAERSWEIWNSDSFS